MSEPGCTCRCLTSFPTSWHSSWSCSRSNRFGTIGIGIASGLLWGTAVCLGAHCIFLGRRLPLGGPSGRAQAEVRQGWCGWGFDPDFYSNCPRRCYSVLGWQVDLAGLAGWKASREYVGHKSLAPACRHEPDVSPQFYTCLASAKMGASTKNRLQQLLWLQLCSNDLSLKWHWTLFPKCNCAGMLGWTMSSSKACMSCLSCSHGNSSEPGGAARYQAHGSNGSTNNISVYVCVYIYIHHIHTP